MDGSKFLKKFFLDILHILCNIFPCSFVLCIEGRDITKKIKQTLILTLAVTMLLGNSVDIRAAAYRESKLSLYGMNNGTEREVRFSVNEKGQLQAIY